MTLDSSINETKNTNMNETKKQKQPKGRKQMKTLLKVLACLSVFASPAFAIDPSSTDANEIMSAVESRTEGDQAKSVLSIKIIDNSGRERSRAVKSYSLKFPEGTKQFMQFEEPADVKNTRMLSVDYKDGGKDDDQWLYLPSLSKTTRISSGEKSGSFMGTDLSFSDMTKTDPKDYEYKILAQSEMVKVAGQEEQEDCWKIEARPKSAKAQEETGYLKSEIWVSKSKLMAVQIKSWIKEGKKLKFIQFANFKQVDGIWVAHSIKAWTKKGNETESTTLITFNQLSYGNTDVNEGIFQQGRLEQGL